FLVPFPENEDYVGKSQVRTFVEEKRANQNTVMSHIKVALHGLGGVGKTQDVLDFVYSCQRSHSVFWIYCESPTRFDEDYRKLAKLVKIPGYNELDPSQNTRLMVKNWLESKDSGDWILVLDNADNKTDLFPESTGAESHGLAKYIPKCAKGTIVITTRDYEVAQQLAGSNGVLHKKPMTSDNAKNLFQKHYPSHLPYDKTDCDELLEELQYLPLAITQVASYLQINRHTITPTQYLAEFQRTKARRQQLLSKPVHNPFRPELPISSASSAETVLTTFEITFRQILTQSPLAGSILRLIACINAQAVPHELLAELASRSDEFLLREALGTLVNFSLLHCQTDSTGTGETTYTLHLLVHLAIQYFMSPEEKVSAIQTTAQVLAKTIPPDGEFENWPCWRQYLPHTTAFLS
ncbi:P-loop containing nucleoside triphosphate hydrolase protein, partial [Pyronema omphalodes]